MSKSKSSASQEQIMPAGKPSSSFITDSAKSGEFGDSPIRCTELGALEGTNKVGITEAYASKGNISFDGVTETSPAGKPSSSFINTSAVK